MLAASRRRPGMTHSEFADYLKNVHGGLARAEPLSLQVYTQNHVFDGAFGTSPEGYPSYFHRDAVVELGFADMAGLAATFSHPYTREVIAPDGANFSDLPSAISLLVREDVLLEPPRNADAVKVMHWIKLADGASAERLGEESERTLATSTEFGTVIVGRSIGSALPPPPGRPSAGPGDKHFGGANVPTFDAVYSFWLSSADDLPTFRPYEQRLAASGLVDVAASFFVYAREITIYEAE